MEMIFKGLLSVKMIIHFQATLARSGYSGVRHGTLAHYKLLWYMIGHMRGYFSVLEPTLGYDGLFSSEVLTHDSTILR